MSLYRYGVETLGLADDLLDFLTVEDVQPVRDLFDHHGYSLFLNIPPKDADQIFVFLGKPPAQQQRQFEKLTAEPRLVFWLRARYLALASADALTTADNVTMLAHGSYRGAHRAIAKAIYPHPQILTIDDLLGSKWA